MQSIPIKLSFPATRQFWEIPVLHHDEQLLAIDKPQDLPLNSPSGDASTPGLLPLLHDGIQQGKPWATALGLSFLLNVHTLDDDAPGVLLFARAKPVHAALANLFGSEKPSLKYLALVNGVPVEDRFEIDAAIGPDSARPGLMRLEGRHGKKARTRFEVVERFENHTLVACQPLTHRLCQVRLHLRRARLSVCGDELYGGKPLWLSSLKPGYRLKPNKTERPLLGHVALYAHSLTLPHPATGQPLTITAPAPRDFNVALKYLRRYALSGPGADANPS